jgi:hypothetical protein
LIIKAQTRVPDDGISPLWYNSLRNVGIGTQTPTGILEIKSEIPVININGTISSGFRGLAYQNNGTSFAYQRVDGSSGEYRQEIGLSEGWGGFYTYYTDGIERMRINKGGFVGIGTQTPTGILEIKSEIPVININGTITSGFRGLAYQNNGTSFAYQRVDCSSGEYRQEIGLSPEWGGFYTFYTDGIERMRINKGGFVGIGTTTPTYKLDVCGTIHAKEIKIDLLGGCDFVFKKDYKLMSLNELEKFVTTKQHLPEIASEKEMIEDGLNMKEFQMKLLQKVEELTLYVIEQNKQIKRQNQEIKKLKAIKKRN